jgi:hypothetical protein
MQSILHALQTRTVLLVTLAAETTAIPVGGFIPKIWATAVGIAVYAILATLAAFCKISAEVLSVPWISWLTSLHCRQTSSASADSGG